VQRLTISNLFKNIN
jgi:hypothetical protein